MFVMTRQPHRQQSPPAFLTLIGIVLAQTLPVLAPHRSSGYRSHVEPSEPPAAGAGAPRILDDGSVDAQGAHLNAADLDQLLTTVDRNFPGWSQSRSLNFTGATFTEDATFTNRHLPNVAFSGAAFLGPVAFTGCRFNAQADFTRSVFHASSAFYDAVFARGINFTLSRFLAGVAFNRATVRESSLFSSAVFSGSAHFEDVQFRTYTLFDDADFAAPASFARARFGGHAAFRHVVMRDALQLDNAIFEQNLDFRDALFTASQRVAPLLVRESLDLDRARFDDDCSLLITAESVRCSGAEFRGHTELRIRCADVTLERAFLRAGSVVTSYEGSDELTQAPLAGEDDERHGECRENAPAAPRLISLREASVEDLHLVEVDLRLCRFAGARGLETIRLDSESVRFQVTPRRFGHVARRVLAEELSWRHSRDGSPSPTLSLPRWAAAEDVLAPAQIARIHRSLRLACERSGEPGEDFYYGEMEMRRRDPSSPGRAGIALSWLTDGYGLKPMRAVYGLVAFAITVGVVFDIVGFESAQSLPRSLLHGFERTTAVIPGVPDRDLALTGAGIAFDIVARIVGAVLIGLTGFLSVQQRRRRS
jgi:hypothetical protein